MIIAPKNGRHIDHIVLIFPIFGIPFVLVGLYLIFGRFLVDAKQRKNRYYGITNERIIILSGLFRRKTRSIDIRNITDLTLDEYNNGTGTIRFGSTAPFFSWFSGWNWPGCGFNAAPSLELVSNAKQVYDMIRDIQNHSK